MSQLVINEMVCPDEATSIGILLALEQLLICVESVQNLFTFILRLTLTKHIEDLEVTRQSVWVFRIPDHMLIQKIQRRSIVWIDVCIVDEVRPDMTPDIQDVSTITSRVKNMVLILGDDIIITKL